MCIHPHTFRTWNLLIFSDLVNHLFLFVYLQHNIQHIVSRLLGCDFSLCRIVCSFPLNSTAATVWAAIFHLVWSVVLISHLTSLLLIFFSKVVISSYQSYFLPWNTGVIILLLLLDTFNGLPLSQWYLPQFSQFQPNLTWACSSPCFTFVYAFLCA